MGVLLDLLTPKKTTARVLLISPVFLLSLEGGAQLKVSRGYRDKVKQLLSA